MEALGVLLMLGVAGLFLLSPILAIVALVRASRIESRMEGLRVDLEALERRIAILGRGAKAADAPTPAPPPAPPPPASPDTPAAVVREAAPLAIPSPPPAPRPFVPPPSVTPRPAAPPPPSRPQPPPPAAPPPEPPGPAFDWESLLGVRGAAWIGGVAVVIAAILFAKWSIDQGLITPELRIAILLAAGIGALVGAELSLRRGYETTANAVSGAGIAILYAAFYAAHALYDLIPLSVTFGCMALVTVVAGLLAIRYDAFFTAVLGLLGGFATPLALSTGVDRPIGLFSYILLLNTGLSAVALRKRWHGLTVLTLFATLAIQIGWFGKFMSPEKSLIGLGVFLIFGLFYLLLPLVAPESDGDDDTLGLTATLGGLAPFLFGALLAGNPRYAGEWPLLFGFVGLLDAALVAVALFRGRVILALGAAVATAVMLPLWASHGLAGAGAWGPSLAAIALAVLLNLPRRVGRMLELESADSRGTSFEVAGGLAAFGLGLFALVLVARGLGDPPWPFLAILGVLLVLLAERTGGGRLSAVIVLGSAALALLVQIWFFTATPSHGTLQNLAVPLILSLALSLLAIRRADDRAEDEAGVVLSVFLSIAGLFGCLVTNRLGGDPLPLFAALAVNLALLLGVALRQDWTALGGVSLAIAAVYSTVWHQVYFQLEDVAVVLPVYVLLYLAFLVLPFAVPEPTARLWRDRPFPWFTSALAGPAFFLVLYWTVTAAWGKGWIGALPVAMAIPAMTVLAGVSRRFPGGPSDPRRLRYMALFAAIALWFVAIAIPLQLDRQWITLGWALEAMAVWWLYGRLPHPGLKLMGAVLFASVGVRLLANPEVLRYHERGWPVLNWLLYTYGLAALCAFLGAAALRRALARRGESSRLVPAAALLGLLLVFALINLEILDYYSTDSYLSLSFERGYARDLTMSAGWGLYALGLLIVGTWKEAKALRYVSLGFLLLTVAKVFLYDLSSVGGIFRVFSFLGLGVSLIVVSLFYQRFVFRKESAS